MKKTGVEKSRWTVPLSICHLLCIIYWKDINIHLKPKLYYWAIIYHLFFNANFCQCTKLQSSACRLFPAGYVLIWTPYPPGFTVYIQYIDVGGGQERPEDKRGRWRILIAATTGSWPTVPSPQQQPHCRRNRSTVVFTECHHMRQIFPFLSWATGGGGKNRFLCRYIVRCNCWHAEQSPNS